MSYLARNIDFLDILLIISGIKPVLDRQTNGSKYSTIGIVCIIIHTVLCIYADRVLAEESRVMKSFVKGIMIGMVHMKRVSSLFYPLVSVFGAILQFGSMSTFLELEDKLEFYLQKCSVNVSTMRGKIQKMQQITAVVAIILGIISAISNASYAGVFGKVNVFNFYSGAFFSLNFTLVTFRICNNFYAMYLRIDLYNKHLPRILRLDYVENVGNGRF